jgi:hypothetical protein
MIYYNVTVKVNNNIAEPWLTWLLQVHIPEVMATGCFEAYRVCRMLETDDTEGPTFSVQYSAKNILEYERYIGEWAPPLRQASFEKWGDQFIAFRSLMEAVN